MKKVLVLVVLVLMTGAVVRAQSGSADKSAAYKAADQLMTVMNMSKSYDDALNQMMDIQAESNPMLSSKKDVMKAFAMKYMSWNELKEDIINLYATEYTENELKDMIVFYKTPTGQKVAQKQNAISGKMAQLGQAKMQEHMEELQKMMSE